ncbi:response regulator [Paenibacillus xanthanilyticus]|uniref:Response regulator n=1 Tax=Paenibacillus xanthanilyticus TaxID=1783531 RepID=A0ABV8K8Q0_9BACL
MIKVLIVDDEPKLRQGLQTLIPWQDLGFIVTATAANGQEALNVVEEQIPDVVIVDIRMPVMDGLQFIQRLSALDVPMHVHVIILSGHADFDYARRAIKYGVAGYLLKPVDIHEMSALLKQVRERMEGERAKGEQRRFGKANRDLLVQHLLIPQEEAHHPSNVRSALQEADLLWDNYEVVLVSPQVPEADRSDALIRLSQGLKARMEPSKQGVVTIIASYVALLLQAPLRGKDRRLDLYRELQDAAEEVRFVAATGGAVSVPEEIRLSYGKAQEAVKRAFFSKEDGLLGPSSPCYPVPVTSLSSGEPSEAMMEELIFRLYYSLDVGNHAMILPLLEEAAACFIGQGHNEKSVKESFFFLSNTVIHKLGSGLRMERKEMESVSRFLNEIYQYGRLDELLEGIRRFLVELATDAEPSGHEQEFKKMIDFINRHYADNLKLETLARLLNYSTAYLGQLFKNRTGEYFNTYVDKVRIEKAKELLAGGMKVYEAAERVGYTSVNYFHSKFKRYEGRSPSDYKNP